MITFENINIYYDQFHALKNINVTINAGEVFVIIGPTGSGKTTFMKCINNLIVPTSGKIEINGINHDDNSIIELRRKIGYVFQKDCLLPHLTVEENIGLVMKILGKKKEEYTDKTYELMNRVELDPAIYKDRFPFELSGGQRQRVGIARGFMVESDIVLLDEPFSAIDPVTKVALQNMLLEINKKMGKTLVFITHDINEAMLMADRVCIIKDGEIVVVDTPENVASMNDEFINSFLGEEIIESYRRC